MPSEQINYSLKPLLEMRMAGQRPFVPVVVTNAGSIANRRAYEGFYTVVLGFNREHDFRPLHNLDVYLWLDHRDFRQWAPVVGPKILEVRPQRFVMCGIDAQGHGRDIYEPVLGVAPARKAGL